MRITPLSLSLVFAPLVLLSSPALAQNFSVGSKVEAYNATTSKWESATVTRIDGGRYLVKADAAGVHDWDVDVKDLRPAGSAVPSVSTTPSSSPNGLGSMPADSGPRPLGDGNTPGNNLPQDGR